MSKAAALPEDILSKVFGNNDSLVELGEFRTVCKSWNGLAVTAMFSRKISVKSELKALQLYRHLFKDSSKISFIRRMDFHINTDKLLLVYGELLRMVHSPKIERFTGNVKANDFFETLLNIEEQLAFESGQLQELPVYSGGDVLVIRKRLFLTRGNITSLRITATLPRTSESWYLLDRLDQFGGLNSLKLYGNTNGLPDLEDILKVFSFKEPAIRGIRASRPCCEQHV